MRKRDQEEPLRLSELQNANGGIVCKKCGCKHMDVKITRKRPGRVRRTRVCRNCGTTVRTVERLSDNGTE